MVEKGGEYQTLVETRSAIGNRCATEMAVAATTTIRSVTTSWKEEN